MELLVKASSIKIMPIQQFRKAVYQSILKRADAFFDLLDALTVAGHVNSPVALSEETPFRRKFSSIFDTLRHGEFDFDLLLQVLHEYQPTNSEELVGCEAYGLDCTPNERPEAETLEDRGSLRPQVFLVRASGPLGNVLGSASGYSPGG